MSKTNLYSLLFLSVLIFVSVFNGSSLRSSQSAAIQTKKIVSEEPFTAFIAQAALPIDYPSTENTITPNPPTIQASIALVKELGSTNSLLKFNTEKRWPIASITKLMTAVIALEKYSKDQFIPISENAFAEEGDSGNLQVNEKISTTNLIKIMIMVSSNDAAAALAELTGRNSFVDLMQQKAASLGMSQTTFFDPTGLSTLNQSTAPDIEKLVLYIYNQHPEILSFSTIKEATIAGKSLKNINSFAGQSDFLGGKTGFIDEARGNLVSLFNYKNHHLLIVVLGADDRFGQTQNLYDWSKSIY